MCKKLKEKYLLVIVTNQPDLKSGKLKKNELYSMHNSITNGYNLNFFLVKGAYDFPSLILGIFKTPSLSKKIAGLFFTI